MAYRFLWTARLRLHARLRAVSSVSPATLQLASFRRTSFAQSRSRKRVRGEVLGLLVFFACLLAGCSRPSRASGSNSGTSLTQVTLQAHWYPQPEHGGFYKEEGLDVTIQPGGPYMVVEQQVSVGAAQFGLGSSDRTLESVADGQALVAVAATMQRDPQGIMVHKDSPIRSFADLNGHTISIKPGYTWFAYLVKRYHLNDIHEIPATMSVANFVADPQYIQQAFATSEPFFAHQAGVETRVLLISETGYNPYRVMFTTPDFLRQHPETVAAFVHASLKGWRDYLNDPSAA